MFDEFAKIGCFGFAYLIFVLDNALKYILPIFTIPIDILVYSSPRSNLHVLLLFPSVYTSN